MPRPLTEFLYAQHLPWTALADGSAVKPLSLDPDSGAGTTIRRLPAGWSGTSAIDLDEEIYGLEGAIAVDGARLGRDHYAFLPAGSDARLTAGEGGATVLSFRDPPRAEPGPRIAPLDVLAMPWDMSGIKPGLEFMGIRRKVLRRDPAQGHQNATFLLATAPHIVPDGPGSRSLTHPCVEEMFMLAGELTGPLGTMRQGAYFWRPADVPHGPFGSREGSLGLLRFVDGPHVNQWGPEELPFGFDTPYAPRLPPHLAALQGLAIPEPDRF